MKKIWIGSVIILLILGGLLLINMNNKEEKGLTNDQILEIIKPKITDYCNLLADDANVSTCATCNFDTYEMVEEFSTSSKIRVTEYTIEKQENLYLVKMQPYIIYGSNTRMGRLDLSFTLDESGNLVEENYPEKTCL